MEDGEAPLPVSLVFPVSILLSYWVLRFDAHAFTRAYEVIVSLKLHGAALLAETGMSKSTVINGFAPYCQVEIEAQVTDSAPTDTMVGEVSH